ncbi:MAG: T9SS type A sorting domain-containing protein, partial [Bacteroidota bacterium]
AGALADLNFLLASANLSTQQSFYIPIEYSLIEDFETGDFSQFSWQFSGNADWQVTNSEAYEGTYSAVSGDIADNQISGLSLTVDSGTDSEVSFWQKVSSESGYDFLIFYIDGTEMNKWSGNTAWSFESYPLQAGTHVLEWIYDKDHSVSNGSDCAWLDLISLPATPTPAEPQASFMATTTSVDVGGSVQYYDVSTGIPDSFSWTFEGGTPAVSEEENPLVTYDQPGTFSVTLEVSNAMGTSVITLDDYIHAGSEAISQVLNIPQGWSGLSTCMVPQNTQPEAMFAGIMDDLVILQDMNGMMYPAMNINTLGSWDYSRGYKIKLEKAAELELQGWNSGSDELTLDPGWNLIPVMTTCPVLVTDVFGAVSGQITVVKDVAATGVYWPSMNINTLQYLLPGRAYFVNALSQIQVSFTECNKYKSATDLQPNMPPEVYNPAPTPVTIVIAVDEQAISELDPAQESYITARGADGQLYGAMIPHEKVLTVFGDDAFSDQKDGAAGSEPLHFYLEDPKKMHSQKLIAEFDAGLIKGNIFVPDALSKITSLKYETSSTDENTAPQICVYPNPATDRLYIEGVSKGDFVRIFNMQGLAVFNKQLTRTHRTNIDINSFPSGSYLILITGTSTHFSEKITIQ